MINKMTFCLEDKIKDGKDQVDDGSKQKLIKLFLECLKSAYEHPVKQFWEVILGRKIYEKKLTEKLFACTEEAEKKDFCQKIEEARKQGKMMENYAAMRMVYLKDKLETVIRAKTLKKVVVDGVIEQLLSDPFQTTQDQFQENAVPEH